MTWFRVSIVLVCSFTILQTAICQEASNDLESVRTDLLMVKQADLDQYFDLYIRDVEAICQTTPHQSIRLRMAAKKLRQSQIDEWIHFASHTVAGKNRPIIDAPAADLDLMPIDLSGFDYQDWLVISNKPLRALIVSEQWQGTMKGILSTEQIDVLQEKQRREDQPFVEMHALHLSLVTTKLARDLALTEKQQQQLQPILQSIQFRRKNPFSTLYHYLEFTYCVDDCMNAAIKKLYEIRQSKDEPYRPLGLSPAQQRLLEGVHAIITIGNKSDRNYQRKRIVGAKMLLLQLQANARIEYLQVVCQLSEQQREILNRDNETIAAPYAESWYDIFLAFNYFRPDREGATDSEQAPPADDFLECDEAIIHKLTYAYRNFKNELRLPMRVASDQWIQSLESSLSPQQRQQLEQDREQRRQARLKAISRAWVAILDKVLFLADEQQAEMEELLIKRFGEFGQSEETCWEFSTGDTQAREQILNGIRRWSQVYLFTGSEIDLDVDE